MVEFSPTVLSGADPRPELLPDQASDPSSVVAALAETLAEGRDGALSRALTQLVSGLGLTSAVLREGPPAGSLIAVAGEVVHAVPLRRGSVTAGAPVELRLAGPRTGQLTVVGARPSQLPALRAAAAVFGLARNHDTGHGTGVAHRLLDAAEAGLAQIADDLHDGPVQTLAAARWALDVAVRESGTETDGALGAARAGVQDALVGLRRTLWQLRPRGATDLAQALTSLSVVLVETGLPPLRVHGGPASSVLSPAAATTVYRLVQAVAAGPVRPDCSPVRVVVRQDGRHVLVDVAGGAPLRDPDRWVARVAALGGDLTAQAGSLRLVLPCPSSPRPELPKVAL